MAINIIFQNLVLFVFTLLSPEQAYEIWKNDMSLNGINYEQHSHKLLAFKVCDNIINYRYAGISSRKTGIIYISNHRIKKGQYSTLAIIYHELGHLFFELKDDSCELMSRHTKREYEYMANWEIWKNEYVKTIKTTVQQ